MWDGDRLRMKRVGSDDPVRLAGKARSKRGRRRPFPSRPAGGRLESLLPIILRRAEGKPSLEREAAFD
jgi:hypothetical protein